MGTGGDAGEEQGTGQGIVILVPRALAACNPIGRRSNYAFDIHTDDRQAPCSFLIPHTQL